MDKLQDRRHPLDKLGIWSYLNFTWVDYYLRKTKEGDFDQCMHPDLPGGNDPTANYRHLSSVDHRKSGLFTAVFRQYGGRFALLLIFTIVKVAAMGLMSVILYLMSKEIGTQIEEHGKIEQWEYIVQLLALSLGLTVVFTYAAGLGDFERIRLALRIQAALKMMVFEKVTRLSLINPCGKDEGSIINNLQTDCERFSQSMNRFSLIFYSFSNLGISVALGSYLFHPIFMLIIALIATSGIPLIFILYYWYKFDNSWIGAQDKRVSLWKSIFTTIRYFKIKAWETYAFERINRYRAIEIKYLFYCVIMFALFVLVTTTVPPICVYVFLEIYFKAGYVLEVAKIAIFIKIISDIVDISMSLPSSFQYITDMAVGIKRLNNLLNTEEVDIDTIKNIYPPSEEALAVEMINAHFFWKKKQETDEEKKKAANSATALETAKKIKIVSKESLLKDAQIKTGALREPLFPLQDDATFPHNATGQEPTLIKDGIEFADKGHTFELRIHSFKAFKGQVTFIIGKIGCGKSSLLQSMIGEMSVGDKDSRFHMGGSVFYVGQKPWIMNSTVRDNILLDKPLDESRIQWAIKYACLDEDIKTFAQGLDTETGEGGDALSGGQRTRLAIASALYQDPDVYIFDDILSALDSFVGSFVMEKTILEQLRGKTVIMSTHALQYLEKGDRVYLLDEGRVAASGSYSDVAHCEIYSKFVEMSKEMQIKENKELEEPKLEKLVSSRKVSKHDEKADGNTEDNADNIDEATKRLMIPEDRERGNVSWHTLKVFINLFGGFKGFMLPFICAVIQNFFLLKTYLILSDWSSNFDISRKNEVIGKYLMCAAISSLAGFTEILVIGYFNYFLAKRLHSQMLYNVLHASLEGFLARVPTGRVMNRFSKDLYQVDGWIMYDLDMLLFQSATLCVNLVAYGILIGYEMVICILIMTVICVYLQRIFMRAKRELSRLDSISKSPFLSTFIDTCRGLPLLRVTNKFDWARSKFVDKLKDNLVNKIGIEGLNQWYNLRTTLVANLVVVMPAYLIIIFMKHTMKVSDIIVMLYIGTEIASVINQALSSYALVETDMIAVERCHHFEKIEPEQQYKAYKEDYAIVDGSKKAIVELKRRQEAREESVVTEGRIEFKGMSCKYATSTGPILDKLTFEIKPREKMGVIGRTGSGKSTLIKLLWRALGYYEGDILIDGHSISKVDLKSLRSQITIVTQETALIEGTLRENIDIRLDDSSKDKELKVILDKLGFSNKNYTKAGLEMQVDAEGSNLSAGEKQLISFARTLFNKRKIIVLDEATASIDLKTEEKIQACIDEELGNTTMLIIAHRVQTIMNCDRILVLEKGKIEALDTPANLSKDRDGYFNSIVRKMNDHSR